MVIAACERYTPVEDRLVDDELAQRFLPGGQRFVVRACRRPALPAGARAFEVDLPMNIADKRRRVREVLGASGKCWADRQATSPSSRWTWPPPTWCPPCLALRPGP